jgi:CheY-like chemotaxis protein
MRPKRILIIDDDPDQVATLAELLQLEGHQVQSATNPLYAMDMARSFQPEIAFIDIGMPYMDGYEAVRRLKRHFAQARMYAITGRSGDDETAKSLAAGFDGHLVKPLDMARITEIVAADPQP